MEKSKELHAAIVIMRLFDGGGAKWRAVDEKHCSSGREVNWFGIESPFRKSSTMIGFPWAKWELGFRGTRENWPMRRTSKEWFMSEVHAMLQQDCTKCTWHRNYKWSNGLGSIHPAEASSACLTTVTAGFDLIFHVISPAAPNHSLCPCGIQSGAIKTGLERPVVNLNVPPACKY